MKLSSIYFPGFLFKHPLTNERISLIKATCFALKVYGYTYVFVRLFKKRNDFCNFLFSFLHDEVLPKRGLLIKERIYSCRSKFFIF